MARNFIAVSGVTDLNQLEAIAAIRTRRLTKSPIAIGFQVSHRSIHEGTANARQPEYKDLERLIAESRARRLIPAIHYYTKDLDTLETDIDIMAETARLGQQEPFVYDTTLLQFNTRPPSHFALKYAKALGFENLFKVAVAKTGSEKHTPAAWRGEGVVDVESKDASGLVAQVQRVHSGISYAMFDPSHGTDLGLDLSPESLAIQFGQGLETDERLAGVGFVYAGGLNPQNVGEAIRTLREYFPHRTSVDIESGVRTPENTLDLNRVEEYLINADKALTEKR